MPLEMDLEQGRALPADRFVNVFLENGGSGDMNVDGSITPVIFDYSNTPEEVIIGKIVFYLENTVVFSSDNFAGITALTNGLLLEVDGATIANWKTNLDIVSSAPLIGGAAEVFGVGTKGISGTWPLDDTVKDIGGIHLPAGELFKATVRDDLSTIGTFTMCIQGVKIG